MCYTAGSLTNEFPMSILQKILEVKRKEVQARSAATPLEVVIACSELMPPAQGFVEAVRRTAFPSIIAEIKRASPSKGAIRPDLNPVETASGFQKAGAACLSVLTDEQFFGGRLQFLSEIKKVVHGVPVLRKDFMIDRYQIWESRAAGADAILLIVAALAETDLSAFLQEGVKAGLDVLIEVHNEAELGVALNLLRQQIDTLSHVAIGINNRDLKTFDTRLEVFERLAPLARAAVPSAPLVAESGLFTGADLKRMTEAGANAFLIGESLVSSGDPEQNLIQLIADTRAIR